MTKCYIDDIIKAVATLEPIGVEDEFVRKVAGEMRIGSSLYLETQFCGKAGRLIHTDGSDPNYDRELRQLCDSSGRWFLIARL